MKSTFIPLFILTFFWPLIGFGQVEFDFSKCSQRLLDKIDRGSQVSLRIRIMLADQVDIHKLDRDLYQNNASLDERASEVIRRLRAKAASSQGRLLEQITQSNDYQSENLRRLWIVNALTVSISVKGVRKLSTNPEISFIDLDVRPVSDDFVKAKPGLDDQKSLDGIEPGLEVINAVGMWDLGYSGYGQSGFILDTGTDGFHPSLVHNFQGLYTPVGQSWLTDNGVVYPYDCDNNGHGTHVAGIAMGLDRLTNDTIGVAFNANWMASPGISCDEIVLSNLEILQWAMDPDANPSTTTDMPAVINNSWRDPNADTCDPMYDFALSALETAGIALVFSAGNFGPDESTITDPKNLNSGLVNTFVVASLNGNAPTLPISPSSSRGPSLCGMTGSLLIKPEVSAPGISVRSSLPGGSFDFYSGTSMAAPHAAGAVLLLKEAFPGLTGTEIKLALYYSAVDLGDPGEDNTFGMGVIDVVAAYNYLISQGHTPADPLPSVDALVVGFPGFNGIECGDLLSPELIIENSGQQPIDSMSLSFRYNGEVPILFDWAGSLQPGERTSVFIPGVSLPTGLHELRVEILSVNGLADDRFYNNRGIKKIQWIQDLPSSVMSSSPVCAGSVALIHVDSDLSGVPYWYNNMVAQMPSDSGFTYISPELTEDTIVYYDVRVDGMLGPVDFSIGPTQSTNDLDNYLVFDALQSFVLKSVKVFANLGAGRLVELRNSNGQIIASKPFGLTAGEHRLALDFKVPAGEDYQLGIGFNSDLTHNFFGAAFPYEIDGIVSLKGTNNGINSNTYYYYYDWEIEYGFPCGRRPVELAVSDGAVEAAFTPSATVIDFLMNNTVSFQNNSAGAIAYLWDFGDGTTSDMFSPSHSFTSPGLYTVALIATDVDGCSEIETADIDVVLSTGIGDLDIATPVIHIHPNPTGGVFYVDLESSYLRLFEWSVFDALGRRILPGITYPVLAEPAEINLTGFPQGIYLLQIKLDNHLISKKIVKY